MQFEWQGWDCAEEREWIFWTKDVEDGAARPKEKMKTTEKVNGCSEGGHVECWCDYD